MNQEEQVQEEQVMEEIVVLDGYTENPGDLSWDGIAEFGTLRVFDRTSCLLYTSSWTGFLSAQRTFVLPDHFSSITAEEQI